MWEYRARITSVVDGTTIEADLDLGFYTFLSVRLRLAGLGSAGKGAKEFIEKTLLEDQPKDVLVRTKPGNHDGEWLAEVLHGSDGIVESLNRDLVKRRLAEPLAPSWATSSNRRGP